MTAKLYKCNHHCPPPVILLLNIAGIIHILATWFNNNDKGQNESGGKRKRGNYRCLFGTEKFIKCFVMHKPNKSGITESSGVREFANRYIESIIRL